MSTQQMNSAENPLPVDKQEEDDCSRLAVAKDPSVQSQDGVPSFEESEMDELESKLLVDLTDLSTLQLELDEVRHKLAQTKSNGQYIPLRLYRSNRWNSMSVSDIQGGLWCEVQLEYRYLHPHMKTTNEWAKREKLGQPVQLRTPSMVQGKNMHLKKELEVHKPVRVKTTSREDKFAIDFIQTYLRLAIVNVGSLEREIFVFGDPFNNGILIKGIIDQVEFKDNSLTILDYKTRKTNSFPTLEQKKGHDLQLMLYKRMLDDLLRGKTDIKLLAKHLGLNFDLPLGEGVLEHIRENGIECLFEDSIDNASQLETEHSQTVEDTQEHTQETNGEKENRKRKRVSIDMLTFGEAVSSLAKFISALLLPPVFHLQIKYDHQGTGEAIGVQSVEYNEEWLRKVLSDSLGFWRGRRNAVGVDIEDLWKCDFCQFRDVCVWRLKKTIEKTQTSSSTRNDKD